MHSSQTHQDIRRGERRAIVGMVAGILLLAVAAAFAIENRHDVDVDFFFEDVTASLSTVIALSAAVGAVIGGIFGAAVVRRRHG